MLKWKRKWWWRDEEDGKFYLNPILAFAILAVAMPLTWVVLDALTKQ